MGSARSTPFEQPQCVDSEYLEYTVRWPEALTENTLLHGKWLSGRGCQGSYTTTRWWSLFALLSVCAEDNRVETKARIPFPFPVESRFEQHFPKFPNSSANVLYATLQAPAPQVHLFNDDILNFYWNKQFLFLFNFWLNFLCIPYMSKTMPFVHFPVTPRWQA